MVLVLERQKLNFGGTVRYCLTSNTDHWDNKQRTKQLIYFLWLKKKINFRKQVLKTFKYCQLE